MSAPQSNLSLIQAIGLYNGVGDVYVAKMTTNDDLKVAPIYDDPILAMEAVQISLSPNKTSGSQSASNRTIRKIDLIDNISVTIQYPRILPAVRAYILGREVDANGGELIGDTTAPNIAVGLCETRDDGTLLMRWLYKVSFSEASVDASTSEEGNMTYRIPSFEGSALKLAYEYTAPSGTAVHFVSYEADTANPNCKWTKDTFFAKVRGPWDEAQSCIPD